MVFEIQAFFQFCICEKNSKIQNGHHFWQVKYSLKIGIFFPDTLWVKNFAEITLPRTVFEIKAFLCFAKNSKWLPFLVGQNFFLKLGDLLTRITLRVQNFIEIALSSTVFEIQAFLCFAFVKKIRKFKMATIFGE